MQRIENLAKINVVPHLSVVQVGNRQDSNAYVRMKQQQSLKMGIRFTHEILPETTTQDSLLALIQTINENHTIHGVLVQLPLPSHIDERVITEAIDPRKDVDGFHSANIGLMAKKDHEPHFIACTPNGIMELLKSEGVNLKGKNAVVVGRSNIVGMPVSHLLQNANATVTVCHSHTNGLPEIVKTADVVIAAVGVPNLIKGEWLKKDAVVIDVGTNAVDDSTKKAGYRWVGDVDYESALSVASAITPVPGGVGPMTVAMLMENTILSAEKFAHGYKTPTRYLHPELKTPVPSDIDIATAQTPKQITTIISELGLFKNEFEAYGPYKAKVSLSVLDRLSARKNANYVVVTGITPTPLGEGKSTTTIGLVQALGAHLKHQAIACVRQPSQGPTFGIKGGIKF